MYNFSHEIPYTFVKPCTVCYPLFAVISSHITCILTGVEEVKVKGNVSELNYALHLVGVWGVVV